MTISERTLRKWRKEALLQKEGNENFMKVNKVPLKDPTPLYQADIIIKLTQELLDQHLLRKE